MDIQPGRPPFQDPDWLSPVEFAHPDVGLTFLTLYRNSRAAGQLDVPGVHHQTALDACRIIANNQDGFLSCSPSRSGRVPLSEVLLTDPMYWYFLADESAPAAYPIVNEFRAWAFPASIPEHWTAAHVRVRPPRFRGESMSDQVKYTDNEVCIATGSGQ